MVFSAALWMRRRVERLNRRLERLPDATQGSKPGTPQGSEPGTPQQEPQQLLDHEVTIL